MGFNLFTGRGGSIHAIRITNSVFHLETAIKQPMPFSASMFYGGDSGPTNVTATPRVYDILFANLSLYLLSSGAVANAENGDRLQSLGSKRSKMQTQNQSQHKVMPFAGTIDVLANAKVSFQFLGLPESIMSVPPHLCCNGAFLAWLALSTAFAHVCKCLLNIIVVISHPCVSFRCLYEHLAEAKGSAYSTFPP
jgi:hypothetical protein